jgi:hypothetical protein
MEIKTLVRNNVRMSKDINLKIQLKLVNFLQAYFKVKTAASKH